MELNAQKLPLYVFAQINSSFIQSAYRIAGGGMQIAESLRQSFESMGGTLLRSKRVTAFEAADGKATAVIVNDGAERYEAQTFISNAHPATTVRLLHTAGLVRKVFQRRIENLENTFGMLTVNVALKPGTLPYQNKNIFAYTENNVWSLHSQPRNGLKAIMISFMPPTDGSPYASGLDILTPMSWDEVSKWFGTKIGCRGEDYVEFKERFADQCLAMAARYVDGLQDAHLAHWVSTPLTYADYTSTADLVGKTVVAEAGSAGESAIQDDGSLSQADYISKSVQTDCLMEVAAGTADAAVLDLTLATAMIGDGTDYANLTIKDELNAEEYGVAFRKGSDAAAAVDAAFDELKSDGTMQKLADKYSLSLAD